MDLVRKKYSVDLCFSSTIPRFVYALKNDFDGNKITSPEIKQRISELGKDLIRISEALS